MEARSAPLGVRAAGQPRGQSAFRLEPGDGFLLFTDGLVERRTEAIDEGFARLLAAVAARAGASSLELVEALPGALVEPHAGRDDVCLLSFRRLPPGAGA